jgi:hypothetical protein
MLSTAPLQTEVDELVTGGGVIAEAATALGQTVDNMAAALHQGAPEARNGQPKPRPISMLRRLSPPAMNSLKHDLHRKA